jgi:N-acylneuraminate cytidylyltransferase
MRPLDLASDESPELDSWKHALRTIESLEGTMPEAIVSVPTTAPLRQTDDVLNCLELYERVQPDLVVTSAPSPHNPYFNLFQPLESGEVKVPMLNSEKPFRRQNVPQVNFITPICYVAKSSYVLNCQNLYEGTVREFSVDPERALDIDTLVDFQFAEFLLSKNRANL